MTTVTPLLFVLVALAGGAGAATRFVVDGVVRARTRGDYPLGTMVVNVTGSLLLGLAVVEGAIDADAAWSAAHVDEDWQAEQWGEDDLALATRTAREADYRAAIRFLALCR